MAGHPQRSTGTRPKSKQNSQSNNQDDVSEDSSTNSGPTNHSNLRDLSSLLRDHEKMKDNMAVMQRALNYAAMGANSTPNRSKSAANSSAPKLGSANPAAAVTGNRTQRLEQHSRRNRNSGDRRGNQGSKNLELSNYNNDNGTSRHEIQNLESSGAEFEMLKNRLLELQDMVAQAESCEPASELNPSSNLEPAYNRSGNNSRLSFQLSRHPDDDTWDSESELVERNLALLTAQYEKNQDEETSSYPPSMSLINRWREGNQDLSRLPPENQDRHPPPENLQRRRANADQASAEQVRLRQDGLEDELRQSREKLERLVKKSLVSGNVNDSGQMEAKTSRRRAQKKERNHSSPLTRPPNPPVRNSSSQPANNTPNSQNLHHLSNLQEEVETLTAELENLGFQHSTASAGPRQRQRRGSRTQSGAMYTVPLELQIQQLALSVNQIYQVMFGLQQEFSTLVDRLASLEEAQSRPAAAQLCPGNSQAPALNHSAISRQLWNQGSDGMVWSPGNSRGINNSGNVSWLEAASAAANLGQPEPPSELLSPFPSRELWNSLQNSPGFNNITPYQHDSHNLNLLPQSQQQVGNLNLLPQAQQVGNASEIDSGVSSGALNNQVSPGMRANNYYDNFRSFSRQNRFGTHPLSAAAANVERRPADSLPANNTASGYNRTRKKYKINREQNRDPNAGERKRQPTNQGLDLETNTAMRDEGVNIYNSPTMESSRDLRPSHSSIDNLAKNIYSQVQAIIDRNEKAPELLANLLDDLTALSSHQNINISPFRREETEVLASRREERGRRGEERSGLSNLNLDVVDTSSITSDEGNNRFNKRSARSKVGSKRLPNQPPVSLQLQTNTRDSSHEEEGEEGATGGVVRLGEGGSNFTSTNNLNNFQSAHNNGSDPRRSSNPSSQSQAVMYGGHNSFPLPSSAARQDTSSNLVSSSTVSSLPAWSNNAHSYAVPKNQQKNLMSRERDSRRLPGWQERGLPRNMQSGESSTASNEQGPIMSKRVPDQDGFINIDLQLPVSQGVDLAEHNISSASQDVEQRSGRSSQTDSLSRSGPLEPMSKSSQSDPVSFTSKSGGGAVLRSSSQPEASVRLAQPETLNRLAQPEIIHCLAQPELINRLAQPETISRADRQSDEPPSGGGGRQFQPDHLDRPGQSSSDNSFRAGHPGAAAAVAGRLYPQNRRATDSDVTEAELAEADQAVNSSAPDNKQFPRRQDATRDPENGNRGLQQGMLSQLHGFQVPIMVGLDRVPIRLPSSQGGATGAGVVETEARGHLENEEVARRNFEEEAVARRQLENEAVARRYIEDEAVASLVEEVLASSPELVNQSSADQAPNPQELN